MIREDIVAGLKNALNRGYSLGIAMQSFLNAGYKKEDVEEAARYVQSKFFSPQLKQFSQQQKSQVARQSQVRPQAMGNQPQQIRQMQQTPQQAQQIRKPASQFAWQQVQQQYAQQAQQPQQQFSQQAQEIEETQKPKKPSKKTLVFLIILLVVLVLGLITVILFSGAIIDFFNNLFIK